MKIAVISHSENIMDTYSISTAIKNQILMLVKHGHEVTYFGRRINTYDFCNVVKEMPSFTRVKHKVDQAAKEHLVALFKKHLPGYDLAITHDFYIADCITYREAIMECGVDINWLHFIRSGIGEPVSFKMPNARYVGLNNTDLWRYAKMLDVGIEQMRAVYNIKDPALTYDWDKRTVEIVEQMRLWEKDIVQIYPFCITRADAKGVNELIRLFAELRNYGSKVGLVFCQANKKENVIEEKTAYIKQLKLEDTDVAFVGEVSQRVVAELQQAANLFAFPTIAETCGQTMLEAALGKNLIIVNKNVPVTHEFVDNAIKFDFSQGDKLCELAVQIQNELKNNKADLAFRQVWRNHRVDAVYEQLEKAWK